MKGRVVLLDEIEGRQAAALMVDGKLSDFVIDPPDDAPPAIGAVFLAKAERALKGQGGLILQLPNGMSGFLRRAKGINPGDAVTVQVSGVAERGKAIPVSTDLVFKSRYAIITPDAPGLNLSRSIRDEEERDRLLEIAHSSRAVTESFGLILRSAAAGAHEDVIQDDIYLMCKTASLVLQESDPPPAYLLDADRAHTFAWREWSEPEPDAVIEEKGAFETHGVFEALDAIRAPRQALSGGGHVFVEQTHALVAVDVNTGSDHSFAAGLKANLAVLRDLPRLLRIKGLGGQVTVDVAPMAKRDRKMVEDAVKKAFRSEGADVVVAGWTPLGNLELTRKRERLSLEQSLAGLSAFC